jgi:ribosomal protein L32
MSSIIFNAVAMARLTARLSAALAPLSPPLSARACVAWLRAAASAPASSALSAAWPQPSLALAGLPPLRVDDCDDAGGGAPAAPSWTEAIWRAVPKRKPSYSVKRQRQMNPAAQNERELHHAYPCPKCDRGYIKLRHHLCPCDAEKLNCKAVVKVRFGIRRRSRGAAEGEAPAPPAGAAES